MRVRCDHCGRFMRLYKKVNHEELYKCACGYLVQLRHGKLIKAWRGGN